MNIITKNNYSANKIMFKAGYGNDYNAVEDKYKRYDDIDAIIQITQVKIDTLNQKKGELSFQLASLMKSYQNTNGLDKQEIEKQIQQIQNEINAIKDKIEELRSYTSQLWYGHHERY